MAATQRQRALTNVGSTRQRSKGATARRLYTVDDENSHSQNDASDSENSAFGPGEKGSELSAALGEYVWYEEYVELSRAYAWRLAAYMAWAASPVVGRQPATQLELAQAIGLKTDRTIRQWKEKDPQIEQVIAQLQAAPLWRHRRDLYEALVKAAVDGDVPALKLAFEMTGDYVPRMKQTVDNTVKPGGIRRMIWRRRSGSWGRGRGGEEERGSEGVRGNN